MSRPSMLRTAILIAAVLLLGACQGLSGGNPTETEPVSPPTPASTVPPPTATTGPVVLELVGPAETKGLSLNEIMLLGTTEGEAGIKSSTGKITLPAPFRGVSLKDLADLIGGLEPGMGINVLAEDGYGITFSYDQVNLGTFTAYDPATGEELESPLPLTAILAYEMDGKPLDPTSDGALRVVIVSPERNQITDGHWSVKWVAKIEVKSLVEDWKLTLSGTLQETIDRASFESCVNCHRATWTDDKAQPWEGVPLWLLAGYVDDGIKHEGPAFNDPLAQTPYVIDVVGADGYEVGFDSARVARDSNLIVALLVNGNPLPDEYFPLRVVGAELTKKEQVGQIARIVLKLEGIAIPTLTAPTPTPSITAEEGVLVITGLVESGLSLTEADLRGMEVVEITAEHPKKGMLDYQGVRLSELLAAAMHGKFRFP